MYKIKPGGKMLRINQVSKITGLKQKTLRHQVKAGQFPPPVRLGKRLIGWPDYVVHDYLQDRIGKPMGYSSEPS